MSFSLTALLPITQDIARLAIQNFAGGIAVRIVPDL